MTAKAPPGAHELLRVATAGSVDDGKSTLIGRLLLDTKQLFDDQLEALETGELAHVTDGLRAEREQGITIDVAYRFFATRARSFIIADTPGHLRYTRNMVTGASTADVAIVLVDARAGIVEQSRRHAYISALLGIRHLVAAVNKMDLVDWDEDTFRAIERDWGELTASLKVPDPIAIPISALEGDNVVDTGEQASWWTGPTLLGHLEGVEVAADRNHDDVRLPVQWVIRDDDFRGFAGEVGGGVLRPGDEVRVLPEGVTTTIDRLESFDGPVEVAFGGMAVTAVLADQLDAGRGALIADPASAPIAAREVDATVCWMGEEPLQPGTRYVLKHTTRRVRATVATVSARVDVATYERGDAEALELNDIGDVTLRLSEPIFADPYDRNRATGAFILIDEKTFDTVGAGLVRETRERAEKTSTQSSDVTWHGATLSRDERWKALGQTGATVWLTGLPASGKSTIATALEQSLVTSGRFAVRLDGDNVRHGLSGDLGFDEESRLENIRRVAHVAQLIAEAGGVAVVALVSPLAEARAHAREIHDEIGVPFLEVFVDTPIGECAKRDPKGLYAKSAGGALESLTGTGSAYEAPENPDLTVKTLEEDVESAVARILDQL
ncbi:MAG: bifunctional enzyme CysN/CysC [Solirubrobacteraceae bacterium]|nr:bifunctional enzyme CysN/CysC [Solirubrobacteraceae bacterium]